MKRSPPQKNFGMGYGKCIVLICLFSACIFVFEPYNNGTLKLDNSSPNLITRVRIARITRPWGYKTFFMLNSADLYYV